MFLYELNFETNGTPYATAFDSEQLAHLPFMELYWSFPLWSLREGVRHARFRLMSDVDAGIEDSRPR